MVSNDKSRFNNSQNQYNHLESSFAASLCFRYTKTVAKGISDIAIEKLVLSRTEIRKNKYNGQTCYQQSLEDANLSLKRKSMASPYLFVSHQKQFVRIKRKAGEMPISTYIREGALHAIVRQPVTKELMKEIRDLNNLGTNINTLVKLAHQVGLMAIAGKANDAIDGVNAVLHQARLKIKEREDEPENQS